MARRVLIAPNAFKHALGATEAAEAIRKGLLASKLDCICELFPVGDGGDGTAQLIAERFNGQAVAADAENAVGQKLETSFALIDDGQTAVIEMASASGIRLLDADMLDPMRASSTGTGRLIKKALKIGVKKIILGMGGSATVDGGCGILHALGVRFLDPAGKELLPTPESLMSLVSIDITRLDRRALGCELIVLCDVSNTLLGPQGAAAIFGPQKGATHQDVEKLELFLTRFARVVRRQFHKDMDGLSYGGTAGGAAAGLWAFLNATLVDGADFFLHHAGFDAALERNDVVVTGEGSIDEQTLHGKAPFRVAVSAKNRGIPVIGIAGRVPLEANEMIHEYFDVVLSIGNMPMDVSSALVLTTENLTRTAAEIGNLMKL